MDHRYWMYNIERSNPAYMKGVQSFLKVAEANQVKIGGQFIWCPCISCKNFNKFKDIK